MINPPPNLTCLQQEPVNNADMWKNSSLQRYLSFKDMKISNGKNALLAYPRVSANVGEVPYLSGSIISVTLIIDKNGQPNV